VIVTFYGVRGSTPAPGILYARTGGHTSCVAVARRDAAVPTLVLDAGTGLRALAAALEGAPFHGTILLGHLHWDHTQGLPFFFAGDREGSEVTVLAPAQRDDADLASVLARMIAPPFFPVTPSELRGRWEFRGVEPGPFVAAGFDVIALEIPHKGGRTFGYRVTDGTSSLAYLSDHMPQAEGPGPEGLGEYHDAALELAAGADLLIHDAQYTADELPARGFFGHAAAEYAVGLAERAGARRLALFHHDPGRSDDEVDAIAASLSSPSVEILVAREGLTLNLRQ
jgi:phosphoribosyl 1,2-cyclic phosphodiesterase